MTGYTEVIAEVMYKSFCWVFSSFFAEVLSFWISKAAFINWIDGFTFCFSLLPQTSRKNFLWRFLVDVSANAKTASRKLKSWFVLLSFFLHRLLIISINLSLWPCMKYCCHTWADAPSRYLDILDKLQRWVCRTVFPTLVASLELFALCRNLAR